MNATALAWARARVRGPLTAAAPDPVPDGLTRVAGPDHVWHLPGWPDDATPALLEEYEITPVVPEKTGQTRRVLAAVLRCCWEELSGSPWPGRSSSVATVLSVFDATSRGGSAEASLASRFALGDLRRLDASGWVLLDEERETVRLGPRVALWPEESLGGLRDLLRGMPPVPGGDG